MTPILLTGCLGYPKNIEPVTGFELDRYLGKWYEIARLDHTFERGLSKVSADYAIRKDGGVSVKNRGFMAASGKWKEAIGKAYFVGATDTGYLKVSFFGPFYGSYVVFELDKDYRYAFVTSSNKSYLWFLSRTPTVSDEMKKRFTMKADELDFETEGLIWVDQD